jgi:hypothetical protein
MLELAGKAAFWADHGIEAATRGRMSFWSNSSRLRSHCF